MLRRAELLHLRRLRTDWINDHPGIPGRVVAQAQAEKIARQTFGPLLAP
ncbi:hypothetical protein ACFWUW_10900 [Streptomyces sp. NPDC058655]